MITMKQILSALVRWFYCLDITDAILLYALAVFVFLLLKEHSGKRLWWKIAVGCIWIIWMCAVAYATLGNRSVANTGAHKLIPFHSYWEVLNGGNIEILRSNLMNLLLFFPAGLLTASLLPNLWKRWQKLLTLVVFFVIISILIEYLQYAWVLGCVEMDDIIHNTLGAVLGGLISTVHLNLLKKS